MKGTTQVQLDAPVVVALTGLALLFGLTLAAIPGVGVEIPLVLLLGAALAAASHLIELTRKPVQRDR